MPEVASAGLSTNATPPNNGFDNKFEILGKPAAGEQRARLNLVSPEYFPVLRSSLDGGQNLGPVGDQARRQIGGHQRNHGKAVFS